MSIYSFQIPTSEHQFQVIESEYVFPKDQCEQIIEFANQLPCHHGEIMRDINLSDTDQRIRKVNVSPMTVDQIPELYHIMYQQIEIANRYFNFDVHGFHEPMQFLHYGEDIGGGHYEWHMDCGPGIATRKITVVVQLTDPKLYTGCNTEIFMFGKLNKKQGSITMFPSYMPHRVTPLKTGHRDALVMWVNGPTYR